MEQRSLGDRAGPGGDGHRGDSGHGDLGGDEAAGDFDAGDRDQAGTGDQIPASCTRDHATTETAIRVANPAEAFFVDRVCRGVSVFYRLDFAAQTVLEVTLSEYGASNLDFYFHDDQGPRYYLWLNDPREFFRYRVEPGTYYVEVRIRSGAQDSPYTLSVLTKPPCQQDADCRSPEYCQYLFATLGTLEGWCTTYQAPVGDAFGPEDGSDSAHDVYRRAEAVNLAAVAGQALRCADMDVDVFTFSAGEPGTTTIELQSKGELELDMALFAAATGERVIAADFDLNGEQLIFAHGPAGQYFLYVGALGYHRLYNKPAPVGQYQLSMTFAPDACALEEDCERLADRPTCSLAGIADPAIDLAPGSCINYLPAAPAASGAYCDDHADCSGWDPGLVDPDLGDLNPVRCHNPSGRTYRDNACSRRCDPVADTCNTELGPGWYCHPVAKTCALPCSTPDGCGKQAWCDPASQRCVAADCRANETCTALTPNAFCAFTGGIAGSCDWEYSGTYRLCDVDDIYENNQYFDQAPIWLLNTGDNIFDDLRACVDNLDIFRLRLPEGSPAMVNIYLVADDPRLFRFRVFAAASRNYYEKVYDSTQVDALAGGSELFVGVLRLPRQRIPGTNIFEPLALGQEAAATSYAIQVSVRAAYFACSDDRSCYTQWDHRRAVCDTSGACEFETGHTDYQSGYGQPCFGRLDCDLRLDPDLWCTQTIGSPQRNACTSLCEHDTDCAWDFDIPGSTWRCVNRACHRFDCTTDDDCPYERQASWMLQSRWPHCVDGLCRRCGSDADCPLAHYCARDLDACVTCLSSGHCVDESEGSQCVDALDPGENQPTRRCGCDADEACSFPNRPVCLSTEICGCNRDADCTDPLYPLCLGTMCGCYDLFDCPVEHLCVDEVCVPF